MKDEDVESGVRRWIEQSGFPLQMHVAHAVSRARPACFELTQSGYYTDPETGKKREGDVIADWAGVLDNATVTLRVAVECKNASKPWVVFTDNADSLMAMETGAMPESLHIEMLNVKSQHEQYILSHLTGSSLSQLAPERIASIVQEAHSSKNAADDAVRQAMATAIGSARDEIADHVEPQFMAVVPVVVTSGPLYSCDLEVSTGEFELHSISHAAVRTHYRVGYNGKIVFILRPDALDWFFGVAASCLPILEDCAQRLDEGKSWTTKR